MVLNLIIINFTINLISIDYFNRLRNLNNLFSQNSVFLK